MHILAVVNVNNINVINDVNYQPVTLLWTPPNVIIILMDIKDYPPAEIAEKGTRIYNERLRDLLEPAHNGEFIVIDVETGEYEVDKDYLAASDRAAAKRPGAPLYASRVGSRYFARIGGRWGPRT